MSLLVVCIALAVGVIIGATERSAIINELHRVAAELHDRLAKLEVKIE